MNFTLNWRKSALPPVLSNKLPMRCNNTLDSEINAEAANTIECDGFSCSHFYYFQSQTHQRNVKNKVLAV